MAVFVIYLGLIIAIIGLVMFALARTNADVKRIGEILMFCGLLAFLMRFAGCR